MYPSAVDRERGVSIGPTKKTSKKTKTVLDDKNLAEIQGRYRK